MDIRQLNYFAVIAEEKNISKAAERLFISQSALSQQLSQLENSLGTRLFLRRRGILELTETGQIYLNSIYHIMHIDRKTDERLSRLRQQTEICIDIGVSFPILTPALQDALTKIAASCPQVRIQLIRQSSRRLRTLLSNGQLQLAVLSEGERRQETQPNGLIFYPLCREDFFLIRYRTAADNANGNEVLPVPVISCLYPTLSECRQLELIRHRLDRPCRHAISLENPGSVPEFVRSLSGVSMLPGSMANCLETDFIRELLPECHFSYVLAAQSSWQNSPYASQIISLIRQAHSTSR